MIASTGDALLEADAIEAYRSVGDGSGGLTSATVFGMDGADASTSVSWADYDKDGSVDLYFVNAGGANKLLRNAGDGTFTDATLSSGTGRESNGMGHTVADFNRDGLQDWFVTSIFRDNPLYEQDGNYLYVNRGIGNWFPMRLGAPPEATLITVG